MGEDQRIVWWLAAHPVHVPGAPGEPDIGKLGRSANRFG
jgi:hypothetical protein